MVRSDIIPQNGTWRETEHPPKSSGGVEQNRPSTHEMISFRRTSEVNRVLSRLTRSLGSGALEAIACSDVDPEGALGETPREHNQGDD